MGGSNSHMQLDQFVTHYMIQGRHLVPARLQTALALLERMRDFRTLKLADHLSPSGAALKSHEKYGRRAHERFHLAEPLNKNYGRRANNIQAWGQPLLDLLRAERFESANQEQQDGIILDAQQPVAESVRELLKQEPLQVRLGARLARAVIAEVLKQAEGRNRLGEVAQYLIGAKLKLRLERDITPCPACQGNRRSRGDPEQRAGDFEVRKAVVEVAMGTPDETHLAQVVSALEDPEAHFWLVTRKDRAQLWETAIAELGVDHDRVEVVSIERFVGQNVSEIAWHAARSDAEMLQQLFEIYNRDWVAKLGQPGIRIQVT